MELFLIIFIIVYSIILHEIAHGYAAYRLGDMTAKYEGRLSLNPLVHIDIFGTILLPILGYMFGGVIFGWAKPVPYNPYNLNNPRRDSVAIALVGPLTNLIIALLCVFMYKILAVFNFDSFAGFDFLNLLKETIKLNIALAVFNFLPIPPLDGSKLLLTKLSFEDYHQLELLGFVLLIFLVFSSWLPMFVNIISSFVFRFFGI